MKISYLNSRSPHLLIPHAIPPVFCISLCNKDVFIRGLNFFCALTLKNKIKKELLKCGYKPLQILGRTKLFCNTYDNNTLNKLSNYLLEKEYNTFNIYMPSFSKAIIQVIDNDGKCKNIIKIAFDEIASTALRKEQGSIHTLKKYTFNNFEIPDVLNVEISKDIVAVEYSCPPQYTPFETLDTSSNILPILTELFMANSNPKMLVTETSVFKTIAERIGNIHKPELQRGLSLILENLKYKFKEVFIPLGIVHYDFKPWNMLINSVSGKLFIVDWELMQKTGLPFWDAYSFILFTHFTLYANDSPQKAYDKFQQHSAFFSQYAKIINIDFTLVEKLLPLYLLDLLTINEFWHRWEKEENRPQRVFDSILRFLHFLNKQANG